MSNNDDNDGMVYSRPGGMTEHERAKIRRRLAGGTLPNASGARQEAPPIFAGSEPSKELKKPELTPEEIEATAAANRAARGGDDPVNGEVDPLDAEHEAVLDDAAPEPDPIPEGTFEELSIPAEDPPSSAPDALLE